MRFIYYLVIIILSFISGYKAVVGAFAYNPYPEICHFVSEHIYFPKENLNNWVNLCLSREKLVKPWSSSKLIIKDVNNVFDHLKVSHLKLYDPSQRGEFWRGEAVETGIESRFIEGKLVISQIQIGSPADEAQLKVFDIIESINRQHPSEGSAGTSSGEFRIRRGSQLFTTKIKAIKLKKDERVKVYEVSKLSAVIKIPSFRENVFADKRWQKEFTKALKYQNIIIDLRGNNGGNFFAGLLVLGKFLCKEVVIGKIQRPRFNNLPVFDLPNDLNELIQVKALKKSSALILKVPATNSLCLAKPKAILIDSNTASVAELVALAFRDHLKVPLLGGTSSGKLLVGLWYDWPELGPGVELSVPEAQYVSQSNDVIEAKGITPDRTLYYHLKDVYEGRDSWIKEATKSLR